MNIQYRTTEKVGHRECDREADIDLTQPATTEETSKLICDVIRTIEQDGETK